MIVFTKIVQCEEEIENYLSTFKSKTEEELKKRKTTKRTARTNYHLTRAATYTE